MMVKSSPDLVIAVRDHDRSEDEPHHQLCKGLQTIEEVEIHGSPPDKEMNKVAETETMERRAPRPSSTDLPKRTTRGESMNFDEGQTERGAESAVSFRKLPFRIRLAIATDLVGGAVHAVDATFRLPERQNSGVVFLGLPRLSGNVVGDFFDIARRMQVLERLGRFLLVQSVLKDDPIQRFEILAKGLFPRLPDARAIDGQRHPQQNDHHADHHHHLDQCESPAVALDFSCHFPDHFIQLEYAVPSRAVWSEPLCTEVMPVCSGFQAFSGSSCSVTHVVLLPVMSSGTNFKYPAVTRSSSCCGACFLSSEYCWITLLRVVRLWCSLASLDLVMVVV